MPIATLDFETEAIQPRPHYPPKPVGVSIKLGGRKSKYYAFGHPTENNCTREEARNVILELIEGGYEIICHNGKFDADVAETHLDIKWPYDRMHDTMILGFLDDPHSKQLALKPMAARLLEREALERDELRQWLVDHGIVRAGATKQWGAHISKAPGKLVGKYACADTDMTYDLFKVLRPKIQKAGMDAAYNRERFLIPILLENERMGVRVDEQKLENDTTIYGRALEKTDDWIRKYLKTPSLNIDSDQEFADALEKAGKVTDWVLTEKGARSTSKESLAETMEDELLLGVLEYRSALSNFHGTFMSPWLEVARETGGWIHTNWQSTAQAAGGGTRTGRLSSTPNFQNIPSNEKLDELIKKLELIKAFKALKLPRLPFVREYIVADRDSHVLCDRDFNGQELRVAAHFEDAEMLAAYKADPTIDLHQYGSDKIKEYVGLDLHRKKVKIIVFTILYGGGLKTIAERLGTTVENAKKLRDAYFKVFPGIKALSKELSDRGRRGEFMRTWGGRVYYAEPPRIIKGELRDFSYKLTNYLIQGSSADITKEAVLRYYATRRDSRLVMTVHDEILISCPQKVWKREMSTLREAMNSIELDVPLLSEGLVGYRWHGMEKTQ